MTNNSKNSSHEPHELSEAQLGQVTGGGGRHIDSVEIESADYPATGGIGAAVSAWNQLLKNYGY